MPRTIDHDQRRRDILEATMRVLGTHGVRGLSFRAIAKELGGSTTLVTHYFASQDDLLRALAGSFATEIEGEIIELEQDVTDPYERLFILIEWLVPTSEAGLVQEKARIAVLADRLASGESDSTTWEERIRALLRTHLEGIVPAGDLDQRVEMLRVLANGLTLSAIEHPEIWSRERMMIAIRQSLNDMGLDRPPRRGSKKLTRA